MQKIWVPGYKKSDGTYVKGYYRVVKKEKDDYGVAGKMPEKRKPATMKKRRSSRWLK